VELNFKPTGGMIRCEFCRVSLTPAISPHSETDQQPEHPLTTRADIGAKDFHP
jgi:hypothetical protein